MAPRRTCVIFNPAAKGERARRFLDVLKRLANQAEWRPTGFAGEGRLLAAKAVQEGFDTIVAAGGDGTLNEVVNGMADVSGGLNRARLGIVPLGTANVFAHELGIPFRPAEAWAVICRGREIQVDLPCASFQEGGASKQRFFVQLGGAGLDSRALERLDLRLKNRVGKLAYFWAGVQALRGVQPRIQVQAGARCLEGELVLVGNGRFYGGRFVLFPNANPSDGLLDVTVFPKASWKAVAGFFLGWAANRPHRAGGSIQFQASALSLTCQQRMPLELEGDNVGELPAQITLLSRQLRVIC